MTSLKQVLDEKPSEDDETISRMVIIKRSLNTNVSIVNTDHYEEEMEEHLMENNMYIHNFEEISWVDPFQMSEKEKKRHNIRKDKN